VSLRLPGERQAVGERRRRLLLAFLRDADEHALEGLEHRSLP
jgi:hypothetical protein